MMYGERGCTRGQSEHTPLTYKFLRIPGLLKASAGNYVLIILGSTVVVLSPVGRYEHQRRLVSSCQTGRARGSDSFFGRNEE